MQDGGVGQSVFKGGEAVRGGLEAVDGRIRTEDVENELRIRAAVRADVKDGDRPATGETLYEKSLSIDPWVMGCAADAKREHGRRMKPVDGFSTEACMSDQELRDSVIA